MPTSWTQISSLGPLRNLGRGSATGEELAEERVEGFPRLLRRSNGKPDLLRVLPEVKREKCATRLLPANHLADPGRSFGRVPELEGKVTPFRASQRFAREPGDPSQSFLVVARSERAGDGRPLRSCHGASLQVVWGLTAHTWLVNTTPSSDLRFKGSH
jgi:hypothetical protein